MITKAKWQCGVVNNPISCLRTLAPVRSITNMADLFIETGLFNTEVRKNSIFTNSRAAHHFSLSLLDYFSEVLEKRVISRLQKHLAGAKFSHLLYFFFDFRRLQSAKTILIYQCLPCCVSSCYRCFELVKTFSPTANVRMYGVHTHHHRLVQGLPLEKATDNKSMSY